MYRQARAASELATGKIYPSRAEDDHQCRTEPPAHRAKRRAARKDEQRGAREAPAHGRDRCSYQGRGTGDHRGRDRPRPSALHYANLYRTARLRVGASWEDIDLSKRTLRVRRRADWRGDMGAPKSANGYREIPLPPIAVNGLREWKLARQRADLDLVFPGRGAAPPLTTAACSYPSTRCREQLVSWIPSANQSTACTHCGTSMRLGVSSGSPSPSAYSS